MSSYLEIKRTCNNPEGKDIDCPVEGSDIAVGTNSSNNFVLDKVRHNPEIFCVNPCPKCQAYIQENSGLKVRSITEDQAENYDYYMDLDEY